MYITQLEKNNYSFTWNLEWVATPVINAYQMFFSKSKFFSKSQPRILIIKFLLFLFFHNRLPFFPECLPWRRTPTTCTGWRHCLQWTFWWRCVRKRWSRTPCCQSCSNSPKTPYPTSGSTWPSPWPSYVQRWLKRKCRNRTILGMCGSSLYFFFKFYWCVIQQYSL